MKGWSTNRSGGGSTVAEQKSEINMDLLCTLIYILDIF